MNKEDIARNTIYMMIRGSHAYGTSTVDSDTDVGGICMPNKDMLFGLDKFEHDDNWVDVNGEKVDKVIYSFNKAIDLMTENNPNMLDFLYAPSRCVIHTSYIWKHIKQNGDLFVSKICKQSFLGYALSQLGRIQTHRGYLLNPVNKPNREDYDLPESPIFPENQYESIIKMAFEFIPMEKRDSFYRDMAYMLDTDGAFIVKNHVEIKDYQLAIEWFKIRQVQFLSMLSSISNSFLDDKYKDMARRELKFYADMKNYKRYMDWDKSRNPKRKELEAKCGYDSKMASHLLRLTRMAVEIMQGKGVNVDRTNIDAHELLDIRMGNQSFDEVMKKADDAKKQAEIATKTSTLPNKPDYDKIADLKRKILSEWIHSQKYFEV